MLSIVIFTYYVRFIDFFILIFPKMDNLLLADRYFFYYQCNDIIIFEYLLSDINS